LLASIGTSIDVAALNAEITVAPRFGDVAMDDRFERPEDLVFAFVHHHQRLVEPCQRERCR
jgi:hypothetical protein